VGSGKKAFCAVHLRSFSANYAQLYPHKLWISFWRDSSCPCKHGNRVAQRGLRGTARAQRWLAGALRPKPEPGVLALLKSRAEVKVTATKNFQES
jgi:hypothetical protein